MWRMPVHSGMANEGWRKALRLWSTRNMPPFVEAPFLGNQTQRIEPWSEMGGWRVLIPHIPLPSYRRGQRSVDKVPRACCGPWLDCAQGRDGR